MKFLQFVDSKNLPKVLRTFGGHGRWTDIGPVFCVAETTSPDGRVPYKILAIECEEPRRYCLFEQETPLVRNEHEKLKREKRATCISGFVYIMRNNRNGHIKIGFSKNPKYREITLQSQEPEIQLLKSVPGSKRQEKELHTRWRHRRIRGEWFELTATELDKIIADFS